ncbi:MAG TPA: C39 family peptidase [Bryobacterales bacterium]|nr:C39 family peptidase [Bryobacterales bacterium]
MRQQDSKEMEPVLLDVPRFAQPDDVTCGPTCLTQAYRFLNCDMPLEEVIRDTKRNPDGGTMAVFLGLTALSHGFQPAIYSYNLRVLDPTWQHLGPAELIYKLEQRSDFVTSKRRKTTIAAYVEYLKSGGELRFDPLDRDLLVTLLRRGQPVLTGLSATYLYQTPRELNEQYDDIRGEPAGHFVVVCGYYPKSDCFLVCDPSPHIPFSRSGKYSVASERLITAILLGDVTYDAVLLTLGRRVKRASQ